MLESVPADGVEIAPELMADANWDAKLDCKFEADDSIELFEESVDMPLAKFPESCEAFGLYEVLSRLLVVGRLAEVKGALALDVPLGVDKEPEAPCGAKEDSESDPETGTDIAAEAREVPIDTLELRELPNIDEITLGGGWLAGRKELVVAIKPVEKSDMEDMLMLENALVD